MRIDNFKGAQGKGKTLSVAGTSQQFTTAGGQALDIFNSGATQVFFNYNTDNSLATATTADGGWSFMIGAGQRKVFDIPSGITNFACIGSAAGPSSVYVAEGEGT